MENEGDLNLKLVFGIIMGAVVLLVVLSMLYSALSVGATYTETFAVTDPSLDQNCTLGHTPDASTVSVEQYTGSAWESIGSGDISISGDVVTVDDGALFG